MGLAAGSGKSPLLGQPAGSGTCIFTSPGRSLNPALSRLCTVTPCLRGQAALRAPNTRPQPRGPRAAQTCSLRLHSPPSPQHTHHRICQKASQEATGRVEVVLEERPGPGPRPSSEMAGPPRDGWGGSWLHWGCLHAKSQEGTHPNKSRSG